jgi:hypothetical protein
MAFFATFYITSLPSTSHGGKEMERRVELGFVNIGAAASPAPTHLVRPPSNMAIILSSRVNDARNIEILPRRRTREEVEAHHAHVAFDVVSAREEVESNMGESFISTWAKISYGSLAGCFVIWINFMYPFFT